MLHCDQYVTLKWRTGHNNVNLKVGGWYGCLKLQPVPNLDYCDQYVTLKLHTGHNNGELKVGGWYGCSNKYIGETLYGIGDIVVVLYCIVFQ